MNSKNFNIGDLVRKSNSYGVVVGKYLYKNASKFDHEHPWTECRIVYSNGRVERVEQRFLNLIVKAKHNEK